MGAPEPSFTKRGATKWDGETDASENSRRTPGVRRRRRLLIGMENLGLKETELYRWLVEGGRREVEGRAGSMTPPR